MKNFIISVYIFQMVSDNRTNKIDIHKSLSGDLKKMILDDLKVEQELEKKKKSFKISGIPWK